tara:strand:- start:269 stop:1429 length:1161 start_codon:yes stop_codon:yes gene_type:complete
MNADLKESATAAPKPMPPARNAKLRLRHKFLGASFIAMVVLPVGVIATYLIVFATDQYHSTMSFSIRSEEFRNPLDALAGLGQISTGTTSDADIVYDFIGSQKIVRSIDKTINLRRIYSSAKSDPLFTISEGVPTEELLAHWNWMVQANFDKRSGLIQVNSYAFDPMAAQQINQEIINESQSLVDRLSQLARDDATEYAEADLQESQERLKVARQNLRSFRTESQLIDPSINVESQGGVTAALQQQLAEALIELDLLSGSASNPSDPRLGQAERRISAIEKRLEGERESLSGIVDRNMVAIVGEYEALIVEREFAEQAFLSAAAALDSAKAEAKRRTKYLAVHIEPTLAELSLYPRRGLIVAVFSALLSLVWAVFTMVAYSFRDRR